MNKFFLIFLLISFELQAECLVTRAAFDIGSGTTKMKVASVDTCTGTIKKIYLDKGEPVPFKDQLDSKGILSESVTKLGVEVLTKMIQDAKKVGAKQFFAVATSAARDAKNFDAFKDRVFKKLNLKVRVIDQKEEALLGYYAVVSKVGQNQDDLVVWDIGGGSMQMTTRNNNHYEIYQGQLASVTFKNHIVENIQQKRSVSPNPIGEAHYKSAFHDAKIVAKFSVPAVIKNKLKLDKTKVIGIGGVHFYSIGGQLNLKEGQFYTKDMLKKNLSSRLSMTDQDLKSDYAQTEVSNLIMIEAFMHELNITKIEIAKINLADGLLIKGN